MILPFYINERKKISHEFKESRWDFDKELLTLVLDKNLNYYLRKSAESACLFFHADFRRFRRFRRFLKELDRITLIYTKNSEF
jgi:hypothetical protein